VSIQPFTFPETGQAVRTVLVDGEPWFVAKDTTDILGYSNGRMAVSALPERMRNTVTLADGTAGNPNRAIVSEPGVYRLVMRSTLPEAERFQDWLAEEVIPALRKTGRYEVARREPSKLELARDLVTALEAQETAEARVRALEPAARSWNVLASANGDWSLRDAALILNRDPAIRTGQNRLNNLLFELGMVDRRGTPYAKHHAHLVERPRTFKDRDTGEERQARPQIRITAAGLKYLHHKLGGTDPLQYGERLDDAS
jgi:anti-repressor protein